MGLRQPQLFVLLALVSSVVVACGSDADPLAAGSAGSTANGGGSAHAGSSSSSAGSSNNGNGGSGNNNTAGTGPGSGTTGIVKLSLQVK